jgi:hypothetical protein
MRHFLNKMLTAFTSYALGQSFPNLLDWLIRSSSIDVAHASGARDLHDLDAVSGVTTVVVL